MACDRCPRRCLDKSFCGFVDPLGGDTHPYEAVMMTMAPVESLPLYHFHPGGRALKVLVGGFTYSCEKCPWEPLARRPASLGLRRISLDVILEKARRIGADAVFFTGAEPLVNDWVIEACGKLEKKIPCGAKTSGYIDPRRLAEAASLAAFMLFELPGAAALGAPMDVILENAEKAGGLGTHLEYVYLDAGGPRSRMMLGITADRLSRDRPLHIYPVAGYVPSESHVEKIASMLRSKGFHYFYIHGDPSLRYENTYCPRCGYPVIERVEGRPKRIMLEENRCPRCGARIDVIGASQVYVGGRVPWLTEEEIVW